MTHDAYGSVDFMMGIRASRTKLLVNEFWTAGCIGRGVGGRKACFHASKTIT
jgi:hypothetical protein